MYSLLYNQEIDEYYICKSRNVIEEDNEYIVVFKAKLISNSDSKTKLFKVQENLLKHKSDEGTALKSTPDKREFIDKKSEYNEKSANLPDGKLEKNNLTKIGKCNKEQYCHSCQELYKSIKKHFNNVHKQEQTKRFGKVTKSTRFFVSKEGITKLSQKKKKSKLKLKKFLDKESCSQNSTQSKAFTFYNEEIKSDELINVFVSKQYQNNISLRTRLRILRRILLKMKKQHSEITDLASLLNQKYIKSLKKMSLLTGLGLKILYECGKLFINLSTNRKEYEKKKEAEEFLKNLVKCRRNRILKIPKQNKKIHKPLIMIKKENIRNKFHTPIKVEDENVSYHKVNLNKKIHVPVVIKKEVLNLKTETTNTEENSNAVEHRKIHKPILTKKEQITTNEKYTLRNLKRIDYSMMNSDEDLLTSKSTLKFCCYCKKFVAACYLPLHLKQNHKSEKCVKLLFTLPKGSEQRKMIIESITDYYEDNSEDTQQNEENTEEDEKRLEITELNEIDSVICDNQDDIYIENEDKEVNHCTLKEEERLYDPFEMEFFEDDKVLLSHLLENHVNCKDEFDTV